MVLGHHVTERGKVLNLRKLPYGLEVKIEKGNVFIGYSDKNMFFRALSITLYQLKENVSDFFLHEDARFETCGMMIDVSRNGVLKVESLKKILRHMACMGLNQLMLYTEDIYEMDNHPYFGYMRGAYTKQELKEVVAYGEVFGIELVPCIQTLGHLGKPLRWSAFGNIKDTEDILLIDEPATYQFIEDMISTMRECFTTDKIHIGMDEAHGIGFGKYFVKHGYEDKFELMLRHLQKVVGITCKYNFKPMMWSDMFFRLGSKTHDYYEMNPEFPKNIAEMIPNEVSMVYWDYYNNDTKVYEKMIEEHKKLGDNIIFGGGIWTWGSPSVKYRQTFSSTRAGLEVCRRSGVNYVFATLWGDDGTECNIFEALLGMQLYAEYNYHDQVTDEHLDKMFHICTGYDAYAFRLLDVDCIDSSAFFTPMANENYSFGETESRIVVISKQVLCQDILLGLFDKNFEMIDLKSHYNNLLKQLEQLPAQEGLEELFDFHLHYVKVLEQKCDLGIRLRKAYTSDDRRVLEEITGELETLSESIMLLHEKMAKLWYASYKPFGFELIDSRFGGIKERIIRARSRVQEYIDGSISAIEELKVERLPYNGCTGPYIHDYFSRRIMNV